MKFNKELRVLAVVAAGFAVALTAGAQSTATTNDPTIQQRKENQQDRIAQGVKSGQLTSGETANLETKEAALNHETRAMKAENGGKLTPADKAVVTHQQNKLSRNIYRDKHNAPKQ